MEVWLQFLGPPGGLCQQCSKDRDNDETSEDAELYSSFSSSKTSIIVEDVHEEDRVTLSPTTSAESQDVKVYLILESSERYWKMGGALFGGEVVDVVLRA